MAASANAARPDRGKRFVALSIVSNFSILCAFKYFNFFAENITAVFGAIGLDVCHNFRHPYLARNPVDFWGRWHISLSTWFRDYIYIPLGGNRCRERRILFNIMATFLLSGLWHGASWNFVIWGAFHGVLLVLWRSATRLRPSLEQSAGRLPSLGQWALMFLLTNIGWLIFREQNPAYLWQFLSTSPLGASAHEWRLGAYFFAFAVLHSLPLWLHAWTDTWCTGMEHWAAKEKRWPRVIIQSAVASLLVIAILLLKTDTASDFIYFQF